MLTCCVLGHAESYNPPVEYLFDEQEKQAWDMLDAEDRKISFIPQKYVPYHSRGILVFLEVLYLTLL